MNDCAGVATQMVGMGLSLRNSADEPAQAAQRCTVDTIGADGKPTPHRYSCTDGELMTQLRFTGWVICGGWLGAACGFFLLEIDQVRSRMISSPFRMRAVPFCPPFQSASPVRFSRAEPDFWGVVTMCWNIRNQNGSICTKNLGLF